jgi:hypothetical protein
LPLFALQRGPLELDGPRFEFLIIFFCPSVEISFCPVKPDFVIGQGAPSKRKKDGKKGGEEEREIQSASWPLNRSSAGQKLAVLGLYRSTDRSILFVMVGHYFGFLLLLSTSPSRPKDLFILEKLKAFSLKGSNGNLLVIATIWAAIKNFKSWPIWRQSRTCESKFHRINIGQPIVLIPERTRAIEFAGWAARRHWRGMRIVRNPKLSIRTIKIRSTSITRRGGRKEKKYRLCCRRSSCSNY